MEQQTPRQHKEMYVLSLDNTRIIWVLSITLLVVVFLFLLGYWIGRDTTGSPGVPAGSYAATGQNNGVADNSGTRLGQLQKKLTMMSSNSSTINYAAMTTPRHVDDLKTKLRNGLKTPREQKEFESLQGKKPKYTEKQTAKVTTRAVKAPASVDKSSATRKKTVVQKKTVRRASRIYSTSGKYSIQVASLTRSGSAAQLKKKLKQKQFRSYVAPAKVNGKQYYRIKVGRFRDIATARKVLVKLKAIPYGKGSYIVTN